METDQFVVMGTSISELCKLNCDQLRLRSRKCSGFPFIMLQFFTRSLLILFRTSSQQTTQCSVTFVAVHTRRVLNESRPKVER